MTGESFVLNCEITLREKTRRVLLFIYNGMSDRSIDLAGLSAEEVIKINSVLARDEKLLNLDQKRLKNLKYRTIGTKDERNFLGKSC